MSMSGRGSSSSPTASARRAPPPMSPTTSSPSAAGGGGTSASPDSSRPVTSAADHGDDAGDGGGAAAATTSSSSNTLAIPTGNAGARGSSSTTSPRSSARSAGAKSPSGRPSSAATSVGGSARGGGAGGKNAKKKKKPINEDPRLVRNLVALCEMGNTEAVKLVLDSREYDGKFDLDGMAGEAMCAAAARGFTDILRLLLQKGGDPNYKSGKPLQQACLASSYPTVHLLLTWDPPASACMPAALTEYTPLMLAAQSTSLAVLQLLLTYTDPNPPDPSSPAALEESTVYVNVNSRCSADQCGPFNGWSALHFAADKGRTEMVRALLEAGAFLEIPNANGETALSIAAEHGNWDAAFLLIQEGANINCLRRGLTPVQWAIYRAENHAVQYLVSHGAVPDMSLVAPWFPDGKTLKEIIFAEFSEPLYDAVDLAVYRGKKAARERGERREVLVKFYWEVADSAGATTSLMSTEEDSAAGVAKRTLRLHLPDRAINLICAYEM